MATKNAEMKTGKEQVQQYLTFLIGGEEYAVNLLKVKEIIEYDVITKVPKTPSWVRGVINLRGSVVPVIDLALKFGQAATEVGKLTCIVITEVECAGEATVMGILADAVSQVIDLKPEEIEAPPAFGTRVKIDYLVGMGRSGKKFCLILDSERVLSTDELLEVTDSLSSGETANTEAAVVPTPQPETVLEA